MINNCSRSFLFFRKILKEGKLRENCRSFGFFNGNNELKYSSDKGDIYLTPKGMHSHTLIWMHGLGDTAEGFLDVFYSNNSPLPKSSKVVLLTAPTMPVTINMGMEMPSWYDITSLDPVSGVKQINQTDLESSSRRIHKHIEEEITLLGGEADKVFVGGFSQGGSLSLFSALQYKENLGGICACSACLFDSIHLEALPSHKKHIPILLYHGLMDPMVKYTYAVDTYRPLHHFKFNIQFEHEDNLGHSFSLRELQIMKTYYHKYMNHQPQL